MRFRILPYNMGSESAQRLQRALQLAGHNVLRVRPDGRYRYRRGDKLINWGTSRSPAWLTDEAVGSMLNKPHAVSNASDKLACFRALYSAEIPTVPFTTDREEAETWLQDGKVYVRHVLNGHSGEGIEIVSGGTVERAELDEEIDELHSIRDRLLHFGYQEVSSSVLELILEAEGARNLVPGVELPDAPLYTKGIENHGEYRVHVFNGRVIDYRKKSRHYEDVPTPAQEDIRTLGNGWIYRASDLRRVERIENLAVSSIEALGLDFGAVDIIKDENGEIYVLEVNTAVGTDDATLANYVEAINQYYAG